MATTPEVRKGFNIFDGLKTRLNETFTEITAKTLNIDNIVKPVFVGGKVLKAINKDLEAKIDNVRMRMIARVIVGVVLSYFALLEAVWHGLCILGKLAFIVIFKSYGSQKERVDQYNKDILDHAGLMIVSVALAKSTWVIKTIAVTAYIFAQGPKEWKGEIEVILIELIEKSEAVQNKILELVERRFGGMGPQCFQQFNIRQEHCTNVHLAPGTPVNVAKGAHVNFNGVPDVRLFDSSSERVACLPESAEADAGAIVPAGAYSTTEQFKIKAFGGLLEDTLGGHWSDSSDGEGEEKGAVRAETEPGPGPAFSREGELEEVAVEGNLALPEGALALRESEAAPAPVVFQKPGTPPASASAPDALVNPEAAPALVADQKPKTPPPLTAAAVVPADIVAPALGESDAVLASVALVNPEAAPASDAVQKPETSPVLAAANRPEAASVAIQAPVTTAPVPAAPTLVLAADHVEKTLVATSREPAAAAPRGSAANRGESVQGGGRPANGVALQGRGGATHTPDKGFFSKLADAFK